ncbi:unnamed protein product [Owenia fusiformis]|uniref:Uncharacterized protein n=1 Tax=Owenia fusiformis TaxID=6347 RepID=A0A8J1XWW7_OWEFU|nr:unnamed protein product [Owenia fusiformis]
MVPEDTSTETVNGCQGQPGGSASSKAPPGFAPLESQVDGRFDEPLWIDVNFSHNFSDILKDIVGEGNILMLGNPENTTREEGEARDTTAPTWARWSQPQSKQNTSLPEPIHELKDILNVISGSDVGDFSSSSADTSTDSSIFNSDIPDYGSKHSWLSQEDRIWSVSTPDISSDISNQPELDESVFELQGLVELIDAMPRNFENPVARQLDDCPYGNLDIVGSPPLIASSTPVHNTNKQPPANIYKQNSNSYFSTPVRIRDQFMGYDESHIDNATPYERFLTSIASCKTCKQANKTHDLPKSSGNDNIVGSTEWLTGLSGGILGELPANTPKPKSKRMASFSQGADPSQAPVLHRNRHLSESALEYMRNNPPPAIPVSKSAVIKPPVSQSTVIRPPVAHSAVIRPPVTKSAVIQPSASQSSVTRAQITESTVIRAIGAPETHSSANNTAQYAPWSQAEGDLELINSEYDQQDWFNGQTGAFTKPLVDYTFYPVPDMKVIANGLTSHDATIDTELMFQ